MEQKLDLAVLRANMLFRNLTDEEVLSVIDTMSPHTMKYEKRTVVARDGDEFPRSGSSCPAACTCSTSTATATAT